MVSLTLSNIITMQFSKFNNTKSKSQHFGNLEIEIQSKKIQLVLDLCNMAKKMHLTRDDYHLDKRPLSGTTF